jgi:hypothetical protein
MKKILTLCLLYFPAFAIFAEEQSLQMLPQWVSVSRSLSEEAKWAHLYEAKAPFTGTSVQKGLSDQHTFVLKERKGRIELVTFKVEDVRGVQPGVLIRERDKDLLLPKPDDLSTLDRGLIRIRPSFALEDGWKLTVSRLKIRDGSLEGRIILRKEW